MNASVATTSPVEGGLQTETVRTHCVTFFKCEDKVPKKSVTQFRFFSPSSLHYNEKKEGLTWVEWIRRENLAVTGGGITQVEKVMFICTVNHLMCQFNCTGRPVGILRHSLEGKI